MTVEFEVMTRIAAPREVVFDVCFDVDAHRASLAGSNERTVGGLTRGLIGLGEDVTWRATHFGIRFIMTSRVTDLDRPGRFVDEHVRGPFARFAHEHVFERDGGATVMIDRVSFDAPFGVIGRVVERLVLGPYLERLIETRGGFLKAEAEKRHRAES